MKIDGIRGGAPDFHSYAIASRVIKPTAAAIIRQDRATP